MITEEKFAALLARVDKMKQAGSVDLSTEEDLSLAVMNLISLEEHFFFTGVKSKKPEYFDWLSEVREMRKELLAKMMDKNEGETWCIAKHLLAATMRLMEVGTKLQADGKKPEAQEMFKRAHKTYALFWGLRLKLLAVSGLKKSGAEKAWSLEEIMDRMVDCCDEN